MDWQNEVIAVWRRWEDGIDLCLERNGNAYYIHPNGTLEPAIHAGQSTSLELIDTWTHTPAGMGFERLELV